jgi:hypothetical protein
MTAVLDASRLYVLEMTGIPAEDTTVTLGAGARRTIILRHGAPDNSTFVELEFGAETFPAPASPESITVTVRPRAGVYGVDVTTSVPPGGGAVIRFKYPVHFAAPLAALARYGSEFRFEQALSVAHQLDNGNFGLLRSRRPALDNLEAALPGAGTYLVVAPK